MSDEREFTVHCPRCARTEITELNTVLANCEIESWALDENNTPIPQDYGDSEFHYDSSEAVEDNPYECRCGWSGELSDLVVVFEEDE